MEADSPMRAPFSERLDVIRRGTRSESAGAAFGQHGETVTASDQSPVPTVLVIRARSFAS